jgi:hypothetical protein
MREIEDIHIPFLAWLNELAIPRVYHRPDRRSGIQVGWPDFTIAWMGRVVFIEAKTPDGRLSKVQENVHKFIRASGNRVEVCRSVEECKEAVRNILCETLGGAETVVEKKQPSGDATTEDSASPQKLNAAPVLAEPHSLGSPRRDGEAREGTPAPQAQPLNAPDSRGGVQFYVGNWKGVPYVFAPDRGGALRMIREASAIDRIRLPKLPA